MALAHENGEKPIYCDFLHNLQARATGGNLEVHPGLLATHKDAIEPLRITMAHPFIPVANTALVEMVYTFGGQIIENTFHVQKGTPFTALQLQGLTTVFDTWDSTGANAFKGFRPIGCILQAIKTRALDTAASPVYIYTLPLPRAGGQNALPMPGNVSFCVTLQTGLAGRSQRGRFYMPGLVTSTVGNTPLNNTVSTSYANGIVASANSLIAAVAAIGAGYALVVTSYRTGGAWRANGVNSVILNAAYADLFVDSMRRRLP